MIEEQNVEQNEQKDINWIEQEISKIEAEGVQFGERLPPLKLEENKVYEIEILSDNPFNDWLDPISRVIKKIVPVIHEGEKKNFWVSTKNPIYKQLLEKCKKGQTKLKLIRVGQGKATRYKIVQ